MLLGRMPDSSALQANRLPEDLPSLHNMDEKILGALMTVVGGHDVNRLRHGDTMALLVRHGRNELVFIGVGY